MKFDGTFTCEKCGEMLFKCGAEPQIFERVQANARDMLAKHGGHVRGKEVNLEYVNAETCLEVCIREVKGALRAPHVLTHECPAP